MDAGKHCWSIIEGLLLLLMDHQPAAESTYCYQFQARPRQAIAHTFRICLGHYRKMGN